MSQYKPKIKARGFTIIEVMIVLAIAGLIMVIVFLAIPVVNRTARNTQRRTDASAALNAVNEYSTNNGGALPPANSLSFAPPKLTIGLAGSAQSGASLGYYQTAGSVTLATAYAALPAGAGDTMALYEGTTCQSATNTAPGTQRQVAVVFGIETASGLAWQCLSL